MTRSEHDEVMRKFYETSFLEVPSDRILKESWEEHLSSEEFFEGVTPKNLLWAYNMATMGIQGRFN